MPGKILSKTTKHKRRHTCMINYRTISQLTGFSYILEKVMHIRLGLDILQRTGPKTVWLQQRNIY